MFCAQVNPDDGEPSSQAGSHGWKPNGAHSVSQAGLLQPRSVERPDRASVAPRIPIKLTVCAGLMIMPSWGGAIVVSFSGPT